jgi:hypothetical protein
MRHPLLIIHESGDRLAGVLNGWAPRKVSSTNECLRALKAGGPGVLVIQLGSDPEHELVLLEAVVRLSPEAATVMVSETDNPELAGLAWDLGADYVLSPPQEIDRLPDLVAGLLKPSMLP